MNAELFEALKLLEETKGIVPDRVVELTEEENKNFYLLSESEDRQLQEAIKVIHEKNAPAEPAA